MEEFQWRTAMQSDCELLLLTSTSLEAEDKMPTHSANQGEQMVAIADLVVDLHLHVSVVR